MSDEQQLVEKAATEHAWTGGYYCACGHLLNSPGGYVRHLIAAVRADIAAEAWDEGARAGLDAGLGAGEWAIGRRLCEPPEAPSNPYRCHCGEPVRFGFDGNPEHHRGMCAHCDAVRCDAYPGACRDRSEVQA